MSGFSDDLLKLYYKRVFPCELFSKWLTYGSPKDFARRELSFTLAGDVYLRYQSFESSSDLRRELVKLCPHKIDIGAVYSASPKQHRAIAHTSFKPEWKELVFDIDLTDYDEVRYCCGEQNTSGSSAMCSRCWQLARCAVLCIDRALREDFGFEHLLWVYSGRRGVHCWVCDRSARHLEPAARSAIVEYLTLVRGGTAKKPVLTAGTNSKFDPQQNLNIEPLLHPCVDAACDMLIPRFGTYSSTLYGQNLFGVPERLDRVLNFLPSDLHDMRDRLSQEWSTSTGQSDKEVSVKRWNTLRTFLKENNRSNTLKELVLNYTYPRLDVNVSTGLNHLLKSPFCVHPKTGYICIPFDPQQVDKLDPFAVPTLSQISEEISKSMDAEVEQTPSSTANPDPNSRHLLAYKKTSLKPAIEYFEAFVSRISESNMTGKDSNGLNNVVMRSANTQPIPAF